VPFVGIRSPSGESPDGQEEERMKNLVILTHVPGDRNREVVLRLSSTVGSADGGNRTRVNTRTGPNGAFRYVVRPAVRGKPKPRLLGVVDYVTLER
jgi:hypothetical protein